MERGEILVDLFDLLFGRLVEVDEDGEVVAQQLGAEGDGMVRRHGAVGPALQNQALVVRVTPETGTLDLVIDLAHRRVHRVDRDPTDAHLFLEVAIRRHVAASLPQAQLDLELAALRQRADVRLGGQALEVRILLDVARRHLTGLADVENERLRLVGVELERNALEVEDQIGRILDDARQRGELVQYTVDLDGGDRRALDGRQQNAAHGVPDGHCKATLERLREELAVPIGERLQIELQPLGPLEASPKHPVVLPEYPAASGRIDSSAGGDELVPESQRRLRLLGVELDDQLFLNLDVDVFTRR